MKKLFAALCGALTFILSGAVCFADPASEPSEGLIHVDGVPGWVWRVVLLVVLFVVATFPMYGDLKQYLATKRSIKKMQQDREKEKK